MITLKAGLRAGQQIKANFQAKKLYCHKCAVKVFEYEIANRKTSLLEIKKVKRKFKRACKGKGAVNAMRCSDIFGGIDDKEI